MTVPFTFFMPHIAAAEPGSSSPHLCTNNQVETRSVHKLGEENFLTSHIFPLKEQPRKEIVQRNIRAGNAFLPRSLPVVSDFQ